MARSWTRAFVAATGTQLSATEIQVRPRKKFEEAKTAIVHARVRIIYLATKSELKYNKTASLTEALRAPAFDTKLHFFPDISAEPPTRKFAILFSWYRELNVFIKKENPNFLWLSEFRFGLGHVLACRAICLFHRCKLISGPHVLRRDLESLFPPQDKTSVMYLMKKCLIQLRDSLAVAATRVVQSYTSVYLKHVCSQSHIRKDTLLVPIGYWNIRPLPARPNNIATSAPALTIAFWGNASALHGLDLLPEAVVRLNALSINTTYKIFSSETREIKKLRKAIEMRNVTTQFDIRDVNLSQENFASLFDVDAAISHLISADADAKSRTIMSYIPTNKLTEIIALGLPAICAATPGAMEFAPDDGVIWVTPCSVDSLVSGIRALAGSAMEREAMVLRARQYAEQKLTPSAIADIISRQLRLLLPS